MLSLWETAAFNADSNLRGAGDTSESEGVFESLGGILLGGCVTTAIGASVFPLVDSVLEIEIAAVEDTVGCDEDEASAAFFLSIDLTLFSISLTVTSNPGAKRLIASTLFGYKP